MRKSLLIIIVIVACILIIFFYSFLSLGGTAINGEASSEAFELPFKIPFISSDSEEGGAGGGTGAAGGSEEGVGGSGGFEEAPYVPSIYVLTIDSIPPNLDVYTEYVFNDTINNSTQPTPLYIELVEGTVVCVADSTGYEGIFWLLDEIGCEFSRCGEFEWGCSILMDGNHTATLRQYS